MKFTLNQFNRNAEMNRDLNKEKYTSQSNHWSRPTTVYTTDMHNVVTIPVTRLGVEVIGRKGVNNLYTVGSSPKVCTKLNT